MPYALSFSAEFFFGDDTIPPDDLPPSDRPSSVYQALRSLPSDTWATLAREVFETEPEHLDCEDVLLKILETNTCSNLDPPVEVWIDPDGFYRVLIYE